MQPPLVPEAGIGTRISGQKIQVLEVSLRVPTLTLDGDPPREEPQAPLNTGQNPR